MIRQQAGLKIGRGSAEWPKWWQAWWHSLACTEDTCFVHMSLYCGWETTVVFLWSDIQTASSIWRGKPVCFHVVYKLFKNVSGIKISTLTSLYSFSSLDVPKALASIKVNVSFPEKKNWTLIELWLVTYLRVFSLLSDYLPSVAKFTFSLLSNLILRAHRKLNMSSISFILTDSKQTPFLRADYFCIAHLNLQWERLIQNK